MHTHAHTHTFATGYNGGPKSIHTKLYHVPKLNESMHTHTHTHTFATGYNGGPKSIHTRLYCVPRLNESMHKQSFNLHQGKSKDKFSQLATM